MYDAVTFDTQTVIHNGYDFDGGLLHQLKQLRHEDVTIAVSDVVQSEIMKYLTLHTQKIISGLETALKKSRDYGVGDIAMPVSGRDAAKRIAGSRLQSYMQALDATKVPSDIAEIREVLRLYFSNLPPFSDGKKSEFPDAVTLLSLEKWAEAKKFKVLAISGDKDWAAFAEGSHFIDVVEDVNKALDLLNGQLTDLRALITKALELIDEGTDTKLRLKFSTALADALEEINVESKAHSHYEVEGDRVALSLRGFWLQNISDFDLLARDQNGEMFVVSTDALISVSAKTDFYFSEFDEIDKDDIDVGGTTSEAKEDWTVQILIALDYVDGAFDVGKIELMKAPSYIDFGFVEPDRDNDFYQSLQGTLF